MLQLALSLAFSTLIIAVSARVLPAFDIKNLLQFSFACVIVGFMNFLMAPVLLGLGLRLKIPSLGVVSFIMNFLLLNLAMGLIDEFGISSWKSALFGSILLTFLQVIMDVKDPVRRKLIT